MLVLMVVAMEAASVATQGGTLIDRYFPMQDGDTKQLSGTGGITETETFYETGFNGNSMFQLQITGDAAGATLYLGRSGNALLLYGMDLMGNPVFFDSPLAVMDEGTAASGGSSSGTLHASPYTFNFNISVSSAGTVTVPMGTFSNCRNVTLSFGVSVPGQAAQNLAWVWVLAPDVGIIRNGIASDDGSHVQIQAYADLVSGTVNGMPIACSCSLDQTSATISGLGGTGTFEVTTSDDCSWRPVADQAWIEPTSSEIGGGAVYYTVLPNEGSAFRSGTISVGGQAFTVTQAPANYDLDPTFGWLYVADSEWRWCMAFGWMWFSPDEWIWSSNLQGWMGSVPGNQALWSPQFGWLTPSQNSERVYTSTLGWIWLGQYNGSSITAGWAVSERFGYVWAAGAGGGANWFFSANPAYGWLGVTGTGAIWCVNQNRWL